MARRSALRRRRRRATTCANACSAALPRPARNATSRHFADARPAQRQLAGGGGAASEGARTDRRLSRARRPWARRRPPDWIDSAGIARPTAPRVVLREQFVSGRTGRPRRPRRGTRGVRGVALPRCVGVCRFTRCRGTRRTSTPSAGCSRRRRTPAGTRLRRWSRSARSGPHHIVAIPHGLPGLHAPERMCSRQERSFPVTDRARHYHRRARACCAAATSIAGRRSLAVP